MAEQPDSTLSLLHPCCGKESCNTGVGDRRPLEFTTANACNVAQGDRVSFQQNVTNIGVFNAPSQTDARNQPSIDGSSCTSERAIFIQSLQQRRKGKLNDFLTDQLTGSSGSERSVDVQRSTNGQMELVFLVDAIEINRRWCLKYPTETARRDSKYFVKQILKNARFDETTPLGATTRTFSIPCQVPAAGHLQPLVCEARSLPAPSPPDSIPMQVATDQTSNCQDSDIMFLQALEWLDEPGSLDTFNVAGTTAGFASGDHVSEFVMPALNDSIFEGSSASQPSICPVSSPCRGGCNLVVHGMSLKEKEEYFLVFTGRKTSFSAATVLRDSQAGLVLSSVSPIHEISERVAVEVVSKQSGFVNQQSPLDFEFRDDLSHAYGARIWLPCDTSSTPKHKLLILRSILPFLFYPDPVLGLLSNAI